MSCHLGRRARLRSGRLGVSERTLGFVLSASGAEVTLSSVTRPLASLTMSCSVITRLACFNPTGCFGERRRKPGDVPRSERANGVS